MADDMTPLHCVLCGYAQGGTTLLSQFVRQHPQIDGRFEIGFLLAESPAAFAQLRSKLQEQILRHWDVTAQDLRKICAAETFQQAYQELLDRSDLPDKNVRIYDKMPRYMGRLAEVMLRCTVPAVVIVRDPRALFWSMNKYANRGRPTVERFCKAYVGQGRRCRAARGTVRQPHPGGAAREPMHEPRPGGPSRGSDYPYILKDDSLRSVLEMIDYVKDSFGGPDWNRGLEIMTSVRERCSPTQIASEIRALVARLG